MSMRPLTPAIALLSLMWGCSNPTAPLMQPANDVVPDGRVADITDGQLSTDLPGPADLVPLEVRAPDLPDVAPDISDGGAVEVLDDLHVADLKDTTGWPDLPLDDDAQDAISDLFDVPPELTDLSADTALDLLDETGDWQDELPLEDGFATEVAEDVTPPPDCDPYQVPPDPAVGDKLLASDFQMVGKAQPDEIYVNAQNQSINKTNEAYVWSIAREGPRTWIGTVSNTLCLGFTGFGGVSLAYETVNAVCANSTAEELFPDWRMPGLWMFDDDTDLWTRRTEPEGTEEAPGIAHGTQGWRAAIGVDDYTLVAGPGMGILWGMPDYGTSLLVYKGGQFVGAHKFTEHNDARKFLEVNGQVYLGSFRWDGKGIILRWNRDESAPPESLFEFTEAGVIDGSAAWLEYYEGRIYAITWPTALSGGGSGFEIWRSPVVPPCGLNETHATGWEKVFAYSDYDTNPSTSKLASGGAMVVFRGALYFGSMHVPFAYACSDPSNLIVCAMEKYLNTAPFSIFRLTANEQDSVAVECLFGQDKGGDYQPLIGPAGFGNHYNNYTWSMAVHDGWLYLGTMDYSFFLEDALTSYGLPGNFPGLIPKQQDGFDLFATSDGDNWSPVVTNGLGNKFNWGARHLLSDGEYLWLGTANPFNLNPAGGWELWRAK